MGAAIATGKLSADIAGNFKNVLAHCKIESPKTFCVKN